MNDQIHDLPHGLRLKVLKDDHISGAYRAGRFYEEGMLDFIRRNKSKGLTIIDAGAYIGGHSVYFDRVCRAKKVYAFEPNPAALELLRQNVELNECRSVEVYDIALGRKSQRGKIVDPPPGNAGMARVDVSARGPVKIKSLDQVLKEAGSPKVDLLKIDVEGMEMDVLEGAADTIRRCRPSIFVECISDREYRDVSVFLGDREYVFVQRFNATPTYYFRPS